MLLCVQDAVQTIIEMSMSMNSILAFQLVRIFLRNGECARWIHTSILHWWRARARESEFNERVLLNNKLNYILKAKEITSERTKNENRKCICSTLSKRLMVTYVKCGMTHSVRVLLRRPTSSIAIRFYFFFTFKWILTSWTGEWFVGDCHFRSPTTNGCTEATECWPIKKTVLIREMKRICRFFGATAPNPKFKHRNM